MPQSGKIQRKLRFDGFALDLDSGELCGNGATRVKLPEQQFQILRSLLERPGQVVSREEIRKRLWPGDTVVEFEHSINAAVNRLRQALNDTAESPRYIETLSRRGYRFIAPVLEAGSGDGTAQSAGTVQPAAVELKPAQLRPHGSHWYWVGGVGAVVLVATLAIIETRYSHRFGKSSLDFHERDWVLISNFENRTGEPVLDGTLEYALQRELSNSQFVRVVSPERVEDTLRLMKKPLNTRIDSALGREICLRDGGIRFVLTGRVERMGSTYVLSVELVDPIDGVAVASLSEDDPADSQMAGAVRRLSDRVRETLGEEHQLVKKSDVQLERVVTPSLHALQLYTQADQAMRVDSQQVAIDLLERALREDHNFASAHLLLGFAYDNSGNAAKARPEFQRAFELANSVTDRERFFILGSYYYRLNDPEKAIATYESLLRLYPDHFWAANNLAGLYDRTDRRQEAVDLWIHRGDLNPRDLWINVCAVWGKAISHQDWGGAQPYINGVNELVRSQGDQADSFSSTYMRLLPVFEDWSHGDIRQAHSKLIEIEDAPISKNLAPFQLGIFHLVFGEFRQADRYFHELANKDDFDGAHRMFPYARGESPPLKPLFPNPLDPRSPVAIDMVRKGMVSEVEKALRKARPYPAPITEGELALARGDTAKATPLFEGGLRAMLPWPTTIFFQGTDSLARAYEKQGKLEDALRILKQAADEKGRTYSFPWVPEGLQLMWQRNQLQLADVYRKLGRITEAEKVEDELSKMLIYADPDHPIVRALKERQHRQELNPSQPAGQ